MKQEVMNLLDSLKKERDKLTNDIYALKGEDMVKAVGRLSLAGTLVTYLEDILNQKSKPLGFVAEKDEN